MAKPSEKQVAAEIKKLKKLRGQVVAYNAFEESNREKIDAQVAVLEERMGFDAIYARFSNDDDHRRNDALLAAEWLQGELMPGEGSPAEDWQTLVDAGATAGPPDFHKL